MSMPEVGSWFPVPAEADLPDGLRGLFAKARERIGFVPNVFRAYSFRPERLSAWFAHFRLLHEPTDGLDAADREMIAVVVSPANGCLYCLVAHGAALREALGDPVLGERISYDWRRAGPRRAAPRDLRLRREADTVAPARSTRADLRRLLDAGLTLEEAWDVAEIAAMYNLTNRMAMATNMLPNEEYSALARPDGGARYRRARPRRDPRPDREASERFYGPLLARSAPSRRPPAPRYAEWGEFAIAQADAEHPPTRGLHIGFFARTPDSSTRSGGRAPSGATLTTGRPARGPSTVGLLRRLPARPGRQQRRGGPPRQRSPRRRDRPPVDPRGRRGGGQGFYETIAPHAGLRLRTDQPERAQFVLEDASFSLVAGEPTAHLHLAFGCRGWRRSRPSTARPRRRVRRQRRAGRAAGVPPGLPGGLRPRPRRHQRRGRPPRRLSCQPARWASPSACSAHQAPAAGPPLQVPSDSPGFLIPGRRRSMSPRPTPLRLASITNGAPPSRSEPAQPVGHRRGRLPARVARGQGQGEGDREAGRERANGPGRRSLASGSRAPGGAGVQLPRVIWRCRSPPPRRGRRRSRRPGWGSEPRRRPPGWASTRSGCPPRRCSARCSPGWPSPSPRRGASRCRGW